MLVRFTSVMLLFTVFYYRLLTYYRLKGNLFNMGNRFETREVTCLQKSSTSQDNY